MLDLEDPAHADGLQPRRERTELKVTIENDGVKLTLHGCSHSVMADETRTLLRVIGIGVQ